MKTIILFLIATTLISTPSRLLAKTTQTDAAEDQTSVIKKLEKIVSIREKIFEGKKSLADVGRLTTEVLVDSEVALIESNINLAEVEGRNDLIKGYLERLIALSERKLASLEAQDRAGVETETEDIANARINLLEVEIRLLSHPQD